MKINQSKNFPALKKITHLKKINKSKNIQKLPNHPVHLKTDQQKTIQNVEPINTNSTKEFLLTVVDCTKYIGYVFKEMIKDNFVSPVKDLLKK